MRRIGVSVVVVALGLVLAASTARAGSRTGLWFEGFGSWNAYSMTDVNKFIAGINEALALAESELRMDEIRSGVGVGFEVGVDLPLTLGLGYERFFATSEVSDEYGGIEFKLPANAFYALAEYGLPASGLFRARLGLAGGLVVLAPVSRIAVTDPDGISLVLTGTGPLFKAYATGECWAGPQVAFFTSAGYRFAKVDQPKIRRVAISDLPIDYSGVFVRAGLKLALLK